MSGVRYHLTEDGPKFCTATVRDCPIGGAHFGSKEEAATAYEFKVKQVHSPFSIFKKKSKTVDPHVKHVIEAEERIKELESEMQMRDQRQENGTLFHELLSEGFSAELLDARFKEETQRRRATIGYGKVGEQEAPVVGVVYGGDFKEEEEGGMSAIAKGLTDGEYEKDDVLYYEKDGRHFFAVKGRDTYIFGSGEKLDPLITSEAKALERYSKQVDSARFEREWDLGKKSFTELKEEFKEKISPMPRSKEKLIEAILDSERSEDYRRPAIGEFQNGKALVIVTEDPLEARLMKKLKEAHDGGHLRVGGPANPFGRGSLFYDDRDLSRENKSDQIRIDVAKKYATAYIAETRAKLNKMHGTVFALTPRVDAQVKDVRDVSYWIDWNVTGRGRVTGLFSKDQLDRMTTGNFSDVN